MKVKHVGFLALLFTLVISAVTLAQAGYDQSAGGAGAISILPLILLGVAFIVGGIFLYKTFAKSQSFQAPHHSQPQTQHPKAMDTPFIPSLPRGSVFISYRRDDSADVTGRIHERLLRRFAQEVVFKDVDSIPLGIDFRQHLENALSQCRVLIAVIGDRWIESGIPIGKRRIDDPRDQLRLELEVALGRNIPVIPVLVRKASIPSEEELPSSLRPLAYRNGIQIRPDPDFNADMDRLIKGIEPHLVN